MSNNLMIGRGRSAARWLLRMDTPLPSRTDAELDTERDAHYAWNYSVNLLDGVFFWFGLSFVSSATILPLFVSKLSDSPVPIALLAVLAQSSWFLPQLFAAGITERIPRMKPIVINLGFFTERLPIVLLPVAALISLSNPLLALVLFFVVYAWHGFGAGLIAPAWSNMLARCFAVEKRGRFFGITSFIGTGLGTLGAFVSGWLLDTFPYPTNFVYIFTIAGLAVFVSWAFLALTREPAGRDHEVPLPLRQQGQSRRKMLAIVKGDHNFRRFLIARVLSSFAAMGEGFLTVAAVRHWQVSDGTVAYFTAAMLLGQTGGNLLAGFVADRWGHKLSLELSYLGLTISFALAWLAPRPHLVLCRLCGAGHCDWRARRLRYPHPAGVCPLGTPPVVCGDFQYDDGYWLGPCAARRWAVGLVWLQHTLCRGRVPGGDCFRRYALGCGRTAGNRIVRPGCCKQLNPR